MTSQILRHAGHVESVRVRFAAVHAASAVVVGNETVYGQPCRWIIETVLERHVRQDELNDRPDVIAAHATTWWNNRGRAAGHGRRACSPHRG